MSTFKGIEKFLDEYSRNYESGQRIALSMERLIGEILSPANIDIHLIKCRYKNPNSVRIKLYEKRYKSPKKQLTDILGARIITYYERDINEVIKFLSKEFDVDVKNSEDKNKRLAKTQFGYKSVHIQACPKQKWVTQMKYPDLANQAVEIQVRSILQHTWAEIEHELVYKSGADFSDDTHRQFARIAGTLEILEREFLKLREEEKSSLIDTLRKEFKKSPRKLRPLDTAGMIAILESIFPKHKGWGSSEVFLPKSDLLCCKALKAAGIKNIEDFEKLLKRKKMSQSLDKLAKKGEEITHYTVCLVAIFLVNEDILTGFFPNSPISNILSKK